MHTFRQWLAEEHPKGVWAYVERTGGDPGGCGFIDKSGRYSKGHTHYDLAKELGFRHGSLELVHNGIRVTTSHKSGNSTEMGFELLANTKLILILMLFIMEHAPDEVYIDLHSDKTSVNFTSFGTHNYYEAVKWLRDKRSELLKRKNHENL